MNIPFDMTSIRNSHVIYNFFITFSIFEFSLKELGFRLSTRFGDVEGVKPDWNRFARETLADFNYLVDDKLKNAVSYLANNPPKHQILSQGCLEWVNTPKSAGENDSQYLLRLIKTVRNNLFHGGKYPYDPIRDTILLDNSLVILFYWARAIPPILELLETANHQLFTKGKGPE